MGRLLSIFLIVPAVLGLVWRLVNIVGIVRLTILVAFLFLLQRSRRRQESGMDEDLPLTA